MEINLNNIDSMEIEDYLGKKFTCTCGKVHSVDVKKVVIEQDAILRLPGILKEFNYNKVFMVADNNTFEAAGKFVLKVLQESGFDCKKLVYIRDSGLVPDERAVGEFLVNIDKNTDVVLAVGTGVLNDLSKYISDKLDIPYIVVATAPSMDGFASDTAALIVDNLKTSYSARPPKAIIGDVNILKNAPMEMILAGLGDVLGKYSSLCDWKLSSIILDEYYCDVVVKMVRNSIQKCIDSLDGYNKRDCNAIKSLMEALALTGIAMSFVGNSRPASGSEHHIAHFQEMDFLFEGRKEVLHGAKVGITTLATIKMDEMLASEHLDFEELKSKASVFDEDKWRREIVRAYKKAATGIFKNSDRENRNSIEKRLQRFEKIQANWDRIVEVLREVPPVKQIEGMLKKVGAPSNPKDIGVDEKLTLDSLMYAKEVRERYTVLQLLWDIGLLEKYAVIAKDYYFKEVS